MATLCVRARFVGRFVQRFVLAPYPLSFLRYASIRLSLQIGLRKLLVGSLVVPKSVITDRKKLSGDEVDRLSLGRADRFAHAVKRALVSGQRTAGAVVAVQQHAVCAVLGQR